jgi:hypothetical protein
VQTLAAAEPNAAEALPLYPVPGAPAATPCLVRQLQGLLPRCSRAFLVEAGCSSLEQLLGLEPFAGRLTLQKVKDHL